MTIKAFTMKLTDVAENQPLFRGEPQTYGMKSGRVFLQPNKFCGEHSTGDREEMLTILQGKGRAHIGSGHGSMDISQGMVVYIPPRTLHNVENTGTEPLVYVYCVAPVEILEREP